MQELGAKAISTKSKHSEKSLISSRELRSVLERSRIIPAIRNPEHVLSAIASPSSIIFLMCGTPSTIGTLIWRLNDAGKMPIINLDLLSGLARDSHAVEFLADAGAAGVISTHQDILRAARALGLISIQRTFAIDSAAINSCLSRFKHFVPDVMELLPAAAGPIVLPKIREAFPDLLIIGCGLVTSIKQIDDMVHQGVTSISASDPSLWVL